MRASHFFQWRHLKGCLPNNLIATEYWVYMSLMWPAFVLLLYIVKEFGEQMAWHMAAVYIAVLGGGTCYVDLTGDVPPLPRVMEGYKPFG